MCELRIAGVVEDSIVDGPGMRLAVFVQGCWRKCEGCHNPHTWDEDGGYVVTVRELVERALRNPLCSGVTITGGEPLLQLPAVTELARELWAVRRSVWLYTGYDFEDVSEELLTYLDAVIDGPYMQELEVSGHRWYGSRNQGYWKKCGGHWKLMDGRELS